MDLGAELERHERRRLARALSKLAARHLVVRNKLKCQLEFLFRFQHDLRALRYARTQDKLALFQRIDRQIALLQGPLDGADDVELDPDSAKEQGT